MDRANRRLAAERETAMTAVAGRLHGTQPRPPALASTWGGGGAAASARDRLGANARRTVVERFNPAGLPARVRAVYQPLLGAGR